MGMQRIIITDEWYINRDNYRTEEFDDFCGAFDKHFGQIDNIKIDQLIFDLDKLNITKNKNIIKIFNYKYKHILQDLNGVIITDVTGFCDVTDFLTSLKSKMEIDYCYKALIQFMHYGGIVRINGMDFVKGDDKSLEALINKSTPNANNSQTIN